MSKLIQNPFEKFHKTSKSSHKYYRLHKFCLCHVSATNTGITNRFEEKRLDLSKKVLKKWLSIVIKVVWQNIFKNTIRELYHS